MERTFEHMTSLGKLGEKSVYDYLKSKGEDVSYSSDAYDQERDLFWNKNNLEVKTQVPYYTRKAFTFRKNQFSKCSQPNTIVAFVSVPADFYSEPKVDGKVFFIKGSEVQKLINSTSVTKDNRQMVEIPFNHPELKEIYRLSPLEIKNMKNSSASDAIT